MQEIDASFLGEHLGLDIHEFHYERIGADRGMLGEIYKVISSQAPDPERS